MQVRVYKNLHRKCYSVQTKKYDMFAKRYKWRVEFYWNEVVLSNPKFVVRESGRLKVLKTGVKNVHAYIQGEYDGLSVPEYSPDLHTQIRYNPKLDKCFVCLFDDNGSMTINEGAIDKVYLAQEKVFM